jgi:two-component system osmolarity sensor histidine kinase EnvZ
MKLSVKKFLPRTLMGRSLLILILPVLLIQVIATYIFFDRHWTKMTSRLAFAVSGEIAMIADQVEEDDGPEELDRVTGYAAQALDFLVSFEPGGSLAPEKAKAPPNSIMVRTLERSIAGQVRRPFIIDVDVQEKWVNVVVQLENGLMHVSLPQRRLFSTSGYIFLLWMIGVSIILLAIAILFMRNQIRPIRRLAVAAERFGRGLDVPSTFKPEGAYEVRQAARAFLDMHERIRRQIQQRTAMLAGVSHDLRTPLTRMKLQTALMPPGPDAEALKTDIGDMERMIEAYLDFARGAGGEAVVRTDLREVIERVAAAMRRLGASVETVCDGDMLVSLRPVAFERCLTNIVGNARQFARHIWVAAQRADGSLHVTVDDDGPGIPPDQYDEVFKPFVRGEPSRNPATGGVGLGLPIVQDIVHSHGGRVWLEKSPCGGLRVCLEIPV